MFSEKILKNLEFIKRLARTSSEKRRRKLLHSATDEQLEVLVEICVNVCRGTFQLKPRQIQKILPHANFVRRLARKKSPVGAKKTIVQQGTGSAFTSLLLPILLALAKHT